MANRRAHTEPVTAIALSPGDPPDQRNATTPRQSAVGPFVAGTLVGGIAGAILGTALSPYTRGLIVGLYYLISRRLTSSERDQLRFELLLQ